MTTDNINEQYVKNWQAICEWLRQECVDIPEARARYMSDPYQWFDIVVFDGFPMIFIGDHGDDDKPNAVVTMDKAFSGTNGRHCIGHCCLDLVHGKPVVDTLESWAQYGVHKIQATSCVKNLVDRWPSAKNAILADVQRIHSLKSFVP